MSDEFISFDPVLSFFGEDKIKERYQYLYDKLQEYINSRDMREAVSINKKLLDQVIIDYFTDIYRLKVFHKIDNINMTKIVAYESYWILKRKPLQIKYDDGKRNYSFVNEGFLTTFVGHEFLMPNAIEPLPTQQMADYLKFLKHLYYCLKYRDCDKQNLETIFLAFETGRRLKNC